MAQYRISQDARADIVDILRHSQAQFGLAARRRYQGLILAALDTIASESNSIGSSSRDEIVSGLRSFHLIHCRSRSPAGKVQRLQHIAFYHRGADDVIEVVRLLHDAMEVQRHPLLDSWTNGPKGNGSSKAKGMVHKGKSPTRKGRLSAEKRSTGKEPSSAIQASASGCEAAGHGLIYVGIFDEYQNWPVVLVTEPELRSVLWRVILPNDFTVMANA